MLRRKQRRIKHSTLIQVNKALCRTWSCDLPTLKFNTGHFVNTRNEKSRKKISRTAKFEVCSIVQYKIWCSSSNLRNIKIICRGKSCWMARLIIQQHFSLHIFLQFLRFKLPPNCLFYNPSPFSMLWSQLDLELLYLLQSFPNHQKCIVE